MKLKFKNQQFQTDAVNAVADLFIGQEKNKTTFDIIEEAQMSYEKEYGTGNRLEIDEQTILNNMQAVQRRNKLPLTNNLQDNNFCIEMETGTGKTYVYTKTIFELNKRYGFTKFIIVVPSVAIREGVYKSLEITKDHFGDLYDNAPCRYFIYNSSKLSDVREFATSSEIEIMIINIDAFRKAENVINQEQEKLNGETAMRYIQDTNPIVIIDEPQSVDNTEKSKNAIKSLNPLCVLRYSATHKEKINMLYRITPVDAYQMGLVKQICVQSNSVENDFNTPYIKLLSVSMKNGFSAKIRLDIADKNGKVKPDTKTVIAGTDLYELSGFRDIYYGYVVEGIDCTPDNEMIEFSNTQYIRLGEQIGGVDESLMKRAQIFRTIETHLNKELMYYDKGIKVLSLFFIDDVKKYRAENGEKGIYAQMFEECYTELISRPKYAPLKDKFTSDVTKLHDGYFSQDKKGNLKNTTGDTANDYNTYNTIMRDKEWLLSFDCPLRFIFSHSALKEGWDNPNVFQICTLIEQKSTFTRRQKIGRGLRLCVNQNGERIEDRNINLLHVTANESFKEFADKLQKEIEDETGVKFGILELSLFADMSYADSKGEEKTISYDDAADLINHFEKQGYIDKNNCMNDKLREDISNGKFDVPEHLQAAKSLIIETINTADKKPVLRDASNDVTVRLKKQVLTDNPAFSALWDKIKQKTTYRVNIDTDKLIEKSVEELKKMPRIPKARIISQTAVVNIEKVGITHTERELRTLDVNQDNIYIPDILAVICAETHTTERTIFEIIKQSGREKDLINNPQLFIEKCADIIRDTRYQLAIDGIKYIKLDGQEYYVQEIFDSEELMATLDKNAVAVENSVYDYIIYDSDTVERPFAIALDNDPDVKMFFKLPSKFKVKTPLGSYNPDWAVYLDRDGVENLYFILETKGTTKRINRRTTENLKIQCGEAHFKVLDDIQMYVATKWSDFKKNL